MRILLILILETTCLLVHFSTGGFYEVCYTHQVFNTSKVTNFYVKDEQ